VTDAMLPAHRVERNEQLVDNVRVSGGEMVRDARSRDMYGSRTIVERAVRDASTAVGVL
jgi:hypothetical protein